MRRAINVKHSVHVCALLLFMTTPNLLDAQEWVKIDPTFDPPGNYVTLQGVFVDAKNGWWIAGPNASVLHTTDGGLSWNVQADRIALEMIEFDDTLH